MEDLSNDDVIHTKKDNLEYIQFKRLLEYKEVVHAFTLRAYDFDIGGNDTFLINKEQYIKNYRLLADALEIDYNNIVRPCQTHSSNVKVIEEKVNSISFFSEDLKNTDGLLTNNSNVIFSLSYADCMPIFLYDPMKKVVGNIHSGWRGTVSKIGQRAVNLMIDKYNCNPEDIICCIGPTIRKDHFEVKEDVKEIFYNKFNYTGKIDEIIKADLSNNSYYIDTVLVNRLMLKEVGLLDKNIIDSNICTACNSSIFHSYRVDGKLSGRNTAIMGLR